MSCVQQSFVAQFIRHSSTWKVIPRGGETGIVAPTSESDDGVIWRTWDVFNEIDGNKSAFLFEAIGNVPAIGRDAQAIRSRPRYIDRRRGTGPRHRLAADRWPATVASLHRPRCLDDVAAGPNFQGLAAVSPPEQSQATNQQQTRRRRLGNGCNIEVVEQGLGDASRFSTDGYVKIVEADTRTIGYRADRYKSRTLRFASDLYMRRVEAIRRNAWIVAQSQPQFSCVALGTAGVDWSCARIVGSQNLGWADHGLPGLVSVQAISIHVTSSEPRLHPHGDLAIATCRDPTVADSELGESGGVVYLEHHAYGSSVR